MLLPGEQIFLTQQRIQTIILLGQDKNPKPKRCIRNNPFTIINKFVHSCQTGRGCENMITVQHTAATSLQTKPANIRFCGTWCWFGPGMLSQVLNSNTTEDNTHNMLILPLWCYDSMNSATASMNGLLSVPKVESVHLKPAPLINNDHWSVWLLINGHDNFRINDHETDVAAHR